MPFSITSCFTHTPHCEKQGLSGELSETSGCTNRKPQLLLKYNQPPSVTIWTLTSLIIAHSATYGSSKNAWIFSWLGLPPANPAL